MRGGVCFSVRTDVILRRGFGRIAVGKLHARFGGTDLERELHDHLQLCNEVGPTKNFVDHITI